MNDTRTLRDRQFFQEAAIDRGPGHQDGCAAAFLATTTTVSSYPTTAQAFYAINPAQLDGDQFTEGASATISNDTTITLYAWNAGTQIPPSGTTIVVEAVGGKLVFRYDG